MKHRVPRVKQPGRNPPTKHLLILQVYPLIIMECRSWPLNTFPLNKFHTHLRFNQVLEVGAKISAIDQIFGHSAQPPIS